MKTPYIFVLLALPFFIAGCNSTAVNKTPETFTATSQNGIAVGTITFEGDKPVNDIYRFFYKALSTDKKFNKRNSGKIEIKARENNERNFNGDFNDKKTYLFIIEQEPGSYAFNQYNYLDHIGANGMVSFSKEFSIPFEIKKGEIAYIGELNYKDKAEKGTPRIFVSGNFSRDIEEFKKKFPNTKWDTATDKTVRKGDGGNGIVEFL